MATTKSSAYCERGIIAFYTNTHRRGSESTPAPAPHVVMILRQRYIPQLWKTLRETHIITEIAFIQLSIADILMRCKEEQGKASLGGHCDGFHLETFPRL
jgi:hypothetical protein